MNTAKPRVAVRVVVITGASAGIGAALADVYAAPGMCLALQGRNLERLAAVAQRCRAQGAEVHECNLDVREQQALSAWLSAFDTQYPVDLVIANAGIASVITHMDEWETPQAISDVLDTNLYGVLNTVLPLAERMRTRGAGHVAIVSSLAALRGMAVSPAYCASKSALRAWGQSIRPLLKSKGVALTLIYPGFVRSAMSDAFPANKPYLIEASAAATLIRRSLDARRASLVFPASLGFGLKLLQWLPDPVADAVMDWLKLSPAKAPG